MKEEKDQRYLKCALCRAPVELRPKNEYFPFCSEPCQMRDLGNWLSESYRIPVGYESTERSLPDD